MSFLYLILFKKEQNHFDDSSINPNKSIKFKKSVSLNIERDELGIYYYSLRICCKLEKSI